MYQDSKIESLKNIEIKQIKKYGKQKRAEELKAIFVQAETEKMAIVITKKVGNAVARNRIRRLIKEAIKRSKIKGKKVVIICMKKPKINNLAYMQGIINKLL